MGKPKEGLKAMLASGDQVFMRRDTTRVKASDGNSFLLYGSAQDKVFACLGELNDHTTTFTTEERERERSELDRCMQGKGILPTPC